MITMGLMQAYAIRVVMSVAIVPIAKAEGYDKPAQGLILSAFFIGYMLPQILGGSLATVHGGKTILTLGILLPSLLTLLTPFVVGSFNGLVLMRVLTGFTEGVTYPAVHALMARWVPANERSILLNVMWCGAFLGSALTLPAAGAAVDSPGGWQVVFYGYGAAGTLWALLFWCLGASSPEQHPLIDARERALIAGSRVAHAGAAGGGAHGGAAEAPLSLRAIPWRAIFTCAPVLSCFAAQMAHNWTFYLLLTWMPNYLKDRLNFDIEGAAALAMIPYLCAFAGSLLSGFLADALIARGVRVLHVRKGMMVAGECVPAALLIAAGFTTSVPMVVAFLSASLFFAGMSQTGFACTPLDVAPQLGGTLMGIQNTLATRACGRPPSPPPCPRCRFFTYTSRPPSTQCPESSRPLSRATSLRRRTTMRSIGYTFL